MVSGYPTSTNLPWVDGLSTDPRDLGCHSYFTGATTFFFFTNNYFFQFYNFFFTQFYSININIFQTFIHTKNSFSITLSHLHSSFKFQFFQYSFSIQIPIFFITHSSFKFQFFHYSFSIQIPSFYYSFSIQIPISTKSWIQIKLI